VPDINYNVYSIKKHLIAFSGWAILNLKNQGAHVLISSSQMF